MEYDRQKFFDLIDAGNHLNNRTREAYWNLFTNQCGKDIKKFYKEGAELFGSTAIHSYVKTSLDNSKTFTDPKGTSDKISPIITPSQKESTTTWGTNDDVRGK